MSATDEPGTTDDRSQPGDDRRLDRAFQRFCEHRDGDALGLVFDGAAPRLLLVAVRLTGDRQSAEDLVQQVFLEAIRAASRFRPGAPVMPWLWTILTRRAGRMQPRERGSGGAIDFAGELESVPGRDPVRDPLSVVASADAVERIRVVVESMSAPYREVLSLRLLHGLEPKEIAASLDRPLHTVNSQLRRGFERLKRALPAELVPILVTAFGSSLLATGALGAMRAGLLSSAEAPLANGVGAAVRSSALLTIMATSTKTLAALATLGLGVWALLSGGLLEGTGEPDAPTRVGVPERTVSGSVDPHDLPSTPRRSSQGTSASASAPDESIDGGALRFDGLVVDRDSRAPLPDVIVVIDPHDLNRLPHHPDYRDPDPVEVRTAADGSFAIELDSFDGDEFGLDITLAKDGYVSMVGYAVEFAAGYRHDLDELPLQRSVPTRVRMVDQFGQPWGGFAAALTPEGVDRLPRFAAGPIEFRDGFDRWFRTDDQGYGPMLDLWPGVYVWDRDLNHRSAVKPPIDPIEPVFEILPGESSREVEFVCPRPDPSRSISGRMIDTDGTPLIGATFSLHPERDGAVLHGREPMTDENGAFLRAGLEPGIAYEMKIGTRTESIPEGLVDFRYEVLSPRGGIQGGQSDLEVVARRLIPGTVTLRVLAPGGEPVDRYSFQLFRAKRSDGRIWVYEPDWQQGRLSRRESARDGTREFEARPGQYRVYVGQSELDRIATQFVEFEIADWGLTQQVELRLRACDRQVIEIVDESGEPVAASVELLRDLIQRPSDGEPRLDRPDVVFTDLADGLPGVSGFTVRLDHSIAEADGRAVLTTPTETREVFLRIRADGYRQQVRPWPDTLAPGPIRVVLEPSAVVVATVTDLDDLLAWTDRPEVLRARLGQPDALSGEALSLDGIPRLRLEPLFDGGDPIRAEMDREQRFRVEGLPLGAYRLVLDPWFAPAVTVRERVDVDRAGTNEVELDLSSLRPFEVEGRVVGPTVARICQHRGSDYSAPTVRLESITSDERPLSATAKLDASGRFRFGALPKGRYRATVSFQDPESGQLNRVAVAGEIVLGAESRTDPVTTELRLSGLPLTVRVVDPDGRPVVGRTLRFEPGDRNFSSPLRGVTDESGTIEFVERPAERVRVFDLGPPEFGAPATNVLGPALLREVLCLPMDGTLVEFVVSH